MPCKFCDQPELIDGWKIKAYRYWTIYIHPNGCYLGRCFIVLNRHADDFFDLTEDEHIEYIQVVKILRDVATQLFAPDMFNYAILGNDVRHVHLNFVPRYSRPVSFAGIDWNDERWGKNYSPYDKEKEMDEEIIAIIIKALGNLL